VPKFIASFSFQPLSLSLADKPQSTVVDGESGWITIEEGPGADRISGLTINPNTRPLAVVRRGPAGNGVEILQPGRTWFVGETMDFNTAQAWVTKVNQLVQSKAPPAPPPTPPSESDAPARENHRPFRKGMTLAAPDANSEPTGEPKREPRPDRRRERMDEPDRPVTANAGPAPKLDYTRGKPSKRELDALIEADLNAALAGLNLDSDLQNEAKLNAPTSSGTPGESRKKAKVVKIHGGDVFLEMPGGRGQGLIPLDQFEGNAPKVGDEVEVAVERYDAANGLVIFSKLGVAQKVADWTGVQAGMTVEVRVTAANKGGLAVELGGIRGFLPFSQIDIVRVEQPELLVNSRVKCMIMEANPAERNLVVSRRMLIEKEREATAAVFWAGLEEGQVKTGTIKSIKPFGAFVDLGGADGLIPMGELSWSRVNDANEVVKVGQQVEVRVIKLDRDAKKIGLSLKAQHQNPWDDFALRARPGTKLTGTVTRIMEFGAFVEVEPGIEGLLHISELSTQRVRRVRDSVTEGQTVEVQVVTVDPVNRKLGLSLKAIFAAAEEAMRAEEADAFAKKVAEEREDRKIAEEKMANRKKNPNLRGGTGGGAALFSLPGS
jgi:small subunit ribosomal protein S1